MKPIKPFIEAITVAADTTFCVVNGVIGDLLETKRTGLAMQMRLHFERKPLRLTQAALQGAGLPPAGRICVLAHGNCSSERGWIFDKDSRADYGEMLRRDFGLSPIYLRYNSGLHISTNGKRLSRLLEKLYRNYPTPISEITLIGHSMGGLLFRSACHYGEKMGKQWVKKVKRVFYLGTPHLGTHLEKIGKLTTTVLNAIPNPVTKAIVRLGDLRSAGIKDLRHGYLTDSDWKNARSENLFHWPLNKVPLLKHATHYLICGTLSKKPDSKIGHFFGDGLVHTASGTGRGLFAASEIPFSRETCKIIPGISHYRLQKSRRVYRQIRDWFESGAPTELPPKPSTL